VGNCNFLIQKCNGTYFAILPQDDLIPLNYFEKLAEAYEKNKQAVNCFPYIQSIGKGTGLIHQPSILGTLEEKIYDVILNHYWAVSFRGLIKSDIPVSLRYLSTTQHQDMMADTLWILQHAIAGDLQAIDLPYYKRYHESGEHMTWSTKSLTDKIIAWSHHCASIYSLALPYVSDHEQLYKACIKRLVQNKQYLVEIKSDDFDHLLLKEFHENIDHVPGKI
jgi:hypothetical protein